jgi:hypothetical protein
MKEKEGAVAGGVGFKEIAEAIMGEDFTHTKQELARSLAQTVFPLVVCIINRTNVESARDAKDLDRLVRGAVNIAMMAYDQLYNIIEKSLEAVQE